MIKKEKEISVYAVLKDFVTLEYKGVVFSGQVEIANDTYNVWNELSAKENLSFNFPSVRQAKQFIRQAFCDEQAPEYACIVVNGKMKGIWWTHTKKRIETITVSRFKRELWANGGVVANEIFKGLWSD